MAYWTRSGLENLPKYLFHHLIWKVRKCNVFPSKRYSQIQPILSTNLKLFIAFTVNHISFQVITSPCNVVKSQESLSQSFKGIESKHYNFFIFHFKTKYQKWKSRLIQTLVLLCTFQLILEGSQLLMETFKEDSLYRERVADYAK